MGWKEESGTVTEAFDEWKLVDSSIRAYLNLTDRWIKPQYQKEWKQAEQNCGGTFDPDSGEPDNPDELFYRSVDGLYPSDYFWMTHAAALRDAVTAFEVYLEKSLEEVLKRPRWSHSDDEKTYRLVLVVGKGYQSPSFGVLLETYKKLGIDVSSTEVSYVRKLRHLLAHQRGELRTDEQRKKFQSDLRKDDNDFGMFAATNELALESDRVVAMLNDLAGMVRRADAVAWSYVHGGRSLPGDLIALTEGDRPFLQFVIE